jgi:hypothetical protein
MRASGGWDALLSGDSRSGNLGLDLLRNLKESSAEGDQDDERDFTPE